MSRRRTSRHLRIAVLATVAGSVCLSGCQTQHQPGYHYSSLGTGMTILLFVVIPLAIFLVVGLLAALPSLLKRPRYRPGRAWDHDPLWFGGPDHADEAIDAAQPGPGKGGASAEW